MGRDVLRWGLGWGRVLRARREAHGDAGPMVTKFVCFLSVDSDGALNRGVSERASEPC